MHTRVMRYAVQHVLDSAATAFTDTNERGTRERHEREVKERGIEDIRGGDRTLDLERVKLAS